MFSKSPKHNDKQMKKIKYMMAVVAMIIVASCSKDLGNYDYKDINEVKIQAVNAEYLVRTGLDTLKIKPTISATLDKGDTTRYRYYWILKTGTFTFDTIARTKNLSYPIRLNPVPYDLFFRMKDTETDVSWIANTKIVVSTPYSRGWLLMGEDAEGYAEGEMLSMLGDTTYVRQILSKSGLPRLKNPISMQHTGGGETDMKLWALTQDGSYFLNRPTMTGSAANNFSRCVFLSETINSETMNPVFLAPQMRTAAGATGSTLYKAVVTKAGDIFAAAPLIMGGDYYNNPINRVASNQNARIPAYPFLFYPVNSFNGFMWYDTQNNRFLNFTSINIGTASLPLTDGANDIFPWNQPAGRTLVYAENTRNTDGGSTNGNSFAIMKDANNTHHIYKFYANGTNPAKRALYTVKSMATDFDKAKFYAFSSNRTVVFYAVANRLYAYDYNPNFEKIYQFPEITADEISMIKFDTQFDYLTNSLYLATYNPLKKGTLRRYKVGTNPNVVELELQPKSTWTGTMKIVNMNWRAVN